MNKKLLSSILIAGSVLSTVPMSNAFAATSFELKDTTKVYMNSLDAKSGKNSVKTYPAGKYYIFKTANGMYNISKDGKTAGAWVNPNTGVVVEDPTTTTTVEPTTTTVAAKKIVTDADYKVYINAADAAAGKNAKGIFRAGEYYIYKIAGEMINITKQMGKAGGWINPAKPIETTTTTVEPTTTTVAAAKCVLDAKTPKYVNSDDAMARKNAKGAYEAGEYFVYKVAKNGMINITIKAGVAGAWINPNPVEPTTTTAEPTTTTVAAEKYTLTAKTDKYVNSFDAKRRVNAKGAYEAGEYFVYKEANGMINITKKPGVAGAWINPTPVVEEPTTPAVPKKGEKYVLTKEVNTYMDSYKARDRKDAVGKYISGDYLVFNTYLGMINISKKAGEMGAWINPADNQ